jgi:hypothetical protein
MIKMHLIPKNKFHFYFFISLIFFGHHVLLKGGLTPIAKVVRLGDQDVKVLIYEKEYQAGDRMFIHVHENEVASLKSGLDFIEKYGGKLVTIQHSKNGVNRNITFTHKGSEYQFDPNRIYSKNKDVVRKALKSKEKNVQYFDEAFSNILSLSETIWGELKNASYLISLHNNNNFCAQCVRKGWFGRELVDPSYNIGSYMKTCDIETESSISAEEIYMNPKINNSEFFIVTVKSDFDFISKEKFNVVLQNQEPFDDGSMSVFALKNGMRYMNAEAKHGKVIEQSAMLQLIKKLN